MTKLKTAMMAAGILSMGAAPLFAVSPVGAATACGIGQSAGACLGAQNAGGGEWVPPTVDLQASPAGSASIRITGPAKLDIPYYAVTFDETITWYQGPGLVQSWSAPVGAAADAFVIPTADTAGQAAVTLNVPGTTGETGDYLIAFPAMAAQNVKILSGIAQMTFTGQGANTLPVTYSANQPIFSLTQNGPWVSTITVPAGVASWSNVPANPAGLVTHATPAPAPSGATETWQSGPSIGSGEVLLPAATPVKVTPTPKPTPVTKVTPTPVTKVTPKTQPVPVVKVTPTPVKKVTPTPVKKTTPTPVKKTTPTPVKKTTPTPQPVPAKKVTPTPQPTPVKSPTPTPVTVVTSKPAPKAKDVLNVTAPVRAQLHQTIPVAIRLTKDGHPLADKVIRMTVSGGILAHGITTTNAEGIARDNITHAPSGKILITAKRAAITAGTVVLVAASAAVFPWWLLLLLVLAAGVLVVIVIRRRRHAAEQNEPTEE